MKKILSYVLLMSCLASAAPYAPNKDASPTSIDNLFYGSVPSGGCSFVDLRLFKSFEEAADRPRQLNKYSKWPMEKITPTYAIYKGRFKDNIKKSYVRYYFVIGRVAYNEYRVYSCYNL